MFWNWHASCYICLICCFCPLNQSCSQQLCLCSVLICSSQWSFFVLLFSSCIHRITVPLYNCGSLLSWIIVTWDNWFSKRYDPRSHSPFELMLHYCYFSLSRSLGSKNIFLINLSNGSSPTKLHSQVKFHEKNHWTSFKSYKTSIFHPFHWNIYMFEQVQALQPVVDVI